MSSILRQLLLLVLFLAGFYKFCIAQNISIINDHWQKITQTQDQVTILGIDSFFNNIIQQKQSFTSDELLMFIKDAIQWADNQEIGLQSEVHIQCGNLWQTFFNGEQPSVELVNYTEAQLARISRTDLLDFQVRLLGLLVQFYGQDLKLYERALPYIEQLEHICYKPQLQSKIAHLPGNLFQIADYYYQIQSYDKSIAHYNYTLNLPYPNLNHLLTVKIYNNLGLCYEKSHQYEAAISTFEKGIAFAKAHTFSQDKVWIGILTGNIGDTYLLMEEYQRAIPYLEFDIQNSLQNGEPQSAYLSLKALASIFLSEHQTEKAYILLSKADSVRQNSFLQGKKDLLSTDSLWSKYYEATQQWEKALNARERYRSLKEYIAQRWRLNELDKIQLQQQFLEEQEALKARTAKSNRNRYLSGAFLILLLSAILAWLFIRYLRIRRQAIQTSIALEQSRQELQRYVEHFKEKSRLATQVERQIQVENYDSDNTAEPSQANEESLTQFTILTDADWEKFKLLFNKVHGNFLQKLAKQDIPLTPAEIRLLALLKLDLNTREIAASLAVSPDTVKKYKQRLRRKLRDYPHFSIDSLIQAGE